MVNSKREGLPGLLLKLVRDYAKNEDTTEPPEEPSLPSVDADGEPMKVYWETDKEKLEEKNQPYLDLFLRDIALSRIPDTTDEPTKELHYNYDGLSLNFLPEAVKNFNALDVPEIPKSDPGISNNGRDAGVIAGIVVAVISGVIILAALIAVVMYRHYVHRNVTSMNFDNPVYRKTTEDQFALEKNGYAPGSKLYPSTVGEEAQEPLNTPGTNEFV